MALGNLLKYTSARWQSPAIKNPGTWVLDILWLESSHNQIPHIIRIHLDYRLSLADSGFRII
jgi:hypothetical protein